jgi:hypothetical protein
MLTLGRAHASMALLSLNRILEAIFTSSIPDALKP